MLSVPSTGGLKDCLVNFIQSVLNLTRSSMPSRNPNFSLHFTGTVVTLLQIDCAEQNEEAKQPSMRLSGIHMHLKISIPLVR